MEAKEFKNFKLKAPDKCFEGEKIHIEVILNKPVVVHHYKIVDSIFEKKKGSGMCLHLQLTVNNEKRVLFSGSGNLMFTIQQIREEDFPFTTIIVKQGKRLSFT